MDPDHAELLMSAVNGCDVPDEAKSPIIASIASAVANDLVTDDDALGTMPAGMRAAYDAAEGEDKTNILADAKEFKRSVLSSQFAARAKAAPVKTETKDAPLTEARFRALVKEEVTKVIPGQGRTANPNGNPVAAASADKTGFSAKRNEIAKKEGCNLPTAMLKARKEDPKAYNAWVAAGRPE